MERPFQSISILVRIHVHIRIMYRKNRLLPNLSRLILMLSTNTILLTLLLTRLRVHIPNNTLRSLPLGALPGRDVQDVHGVDFLEGTALGLVDEEVDGEDTGEAASGEDVAVGKVDGVGDEGGEEGDEEVPGPVGGCGDTDGDGTVAGWVQFTADCPHHWAPCGGIAWTY